MDTVYFYAHLIAYVYGGEPVGSRKTRKPDIIFLQSKLKISNIFVFKKSLTMIAI